MGTRSSACPFHRTYLLIHQTHCVESVHRPLSLDCLHWEPAQDLQNPPCDCQILNHIVEGRSQFAILFTFAVWFRCHQAAPWAKDQHEVYRYIMACLDKMSLSGTDLTLPHPDASDQPCGLPGMSKRSLLPSFIGQGTRSTIATVPLSWWSHDFCLDARTCS